jgi:hypothetical protein
MKWKSASGVLCDKKVLLKLKGKFYSTAVSDFEISIHRTGHTYTLAQCPHPYSTHTNNISMFLNVDRVL